MPSRRIHVACDYMLAREMGVSMLEGVVEAIETLIDHPSRSKGVLERARARICSQNIYSSDCTLLSTVLSGLRIKGVARHDWRSLRGAMLLRRIISELWGPEYLWIADLHFALDCLEQGGRQCSRVNLELADWARRNCSHLLTPSPQQFSLASQSSFIIERRTYEGSAVREG